MATKEYSIKINGLQESISQVTALEQKLTQLEARLNALNSKGVKVGGGGGSSTSELTAEEKLLKQIENTENKIQQARSNDYKTLVKTKDELKKIQTIQKANAAGEKLVDGDYNLKTMTGIKEKLLDIKRLLNDTEIGSTEFNELTEQANELNQKLKEIEQSYGQFGRNVGNYQSAFDGFTNFTIKIGDAERSFSSLREASRELRKEMGSLEIQGKNDTKQYKELKDALDDVTKAEQRLQSSMKDVQNSSKGMDALLDTFESIGAIGSIGSGLKAFFGFDDVEIQRSIQRLVSLQNVLQGIEKIHRQMNTQEGFGLILTKGSTAVDKFVASLTGAKLTTEGLTMATNGATKAVRALSSALKFVGVGLAIGAITLLVSAISALKKGVGEGVTATDILNGQMQNLNDTIQRQKDLLKGQYLSGVISQEEYLNGIHKADNEYLEKNISLLKQRSKLEETWADKVGLFSRLGEKTYGKKFNMEGVQKSYSANSTWGELFGGWIGGAINVGKGKGSSLKLEVEVDGIDDAKKKYKELEEELLKVRDTGQRISDFFTFRRTNQSTLLKNLGVDILGDFINRCQEVDLEAPDAQKKIAALYEEMNSDEALRSILVNLDKFIPQEEFRDSINNIIGALKDLGEAARTEGENFAKAMRQLEIDAMPDQGLSAYAKQRAELAEQEKQELLQYEGNEELRTAVAKKYAKLRADIARDEAKAIRDAQNEIANYRIEAMREGLAKQLAQLEQEKKQRIQQAVDSGILVGEKKLEIENSYNARVLEAEREWAKQMEEAYKGFFEEVQDLEFDNMLSMQENKLLQFENEYKDKLTKLSAYISGEISKGLNLSYPTSFTMQGRMEDVFGIDNRHIWKAYEEITNVIEHYNLERQKAAVEYANDILKVEKASIETRRVQESIAADREMEDLKKRLEEQMKVEIDGLVKNEEYEKNKLAIREKYNKLIEDAEIQHRAKLKNIEEQAINEENQSALKYNEAVQNSNKEFFDSQIKAYQEGFNKMNELANKNPIANNRFGVVNLGLTSENYKEALIGFEMLGKDILREKERLQDQLDKDQISFDDFRVAKEELDSLQQSVADAAENVKRKQVELIGDFIQSIQGYITYGLQVISQITSLVAQAEDQAYQERIDSLDKFISKYEEMLDKQEEITQEHSDKINDIESELSTARGDRRQELIDQLNAQKAAQRASLAEEKKIEKEKEKLEKQKEREEIRQKKREQNRSIIQAIINAASAAASGFATQPFIPVGLAMGALASALGLAQVAIIKSQKFAKGGMLQGRSHSQGGIPVGNTGIEVEGNEYVVRKETTTKNVDLLDYINNKQRKLRLEDFIDFYGGKVGKNIRSFSPNAKYADGGILPTLRDDIDVQYGLQRSLEMYANKPTVVSVVDINSAQERVKRVQTLAGLNS